MTTALKSGRPPWAVTIWTDEANIYVEFPTKTGTPYIAKYSLSEGGLSKALHFMMQRHREAGAARYAIQNDVVACFNQSRAGTPEQRAAAHAMLKNLKLV